MHQSKQCRTTTVLNSVVAVHKILETDMLYILSVSVLFTVWIPSHRELKGAKCYPIKCWAQGASLNPNGKTYFFFLPIVVSIILLVSLRAVTERNPVPFRMNSHEILGKCQNHVPLARLELLALGKREVWLGTCLRKLVT